MHHNEAHFEIRRAAARNLHGVSVPAFSTTDPMAGDDSWQRIGGDIVGEYRRGRERAYLARVTYPTRGFISAYGAVPDSMPEPFAHLQE